MAFDFPNSPSEGQIFNAPSGPSYVFQSPTWRAVGQGQIAIISDTAPLNPANGTLWYESDTGILFIYMNDGNSSQWVQAGGIAASGAMVQRLVIASETWTKPAGLRYLEVEGVGAGGAGGGAIGTGATQHAVGGGGGGGAYGKKLFTASELPASVVITIAPGGTGVLAAAGNNAGTTTFGGLLTLSGGAGGSHSGVATTWARTAGGSGGSIATGFDVNAPGNPGDFSICFFTSSFAFFGKGGTSPWGGAQTGEGFTVSTGGGGGAVGYGAGGNGCANGLSQVNKTGGNGSSAAILLKEIY